MPTVHLDLEEPIHSIKQVFGDKESGPIVEEWVVFKVSPVKERRFTFSNGDIFAHDDQHDWFQGAPKVIGGTLIVRRDSGRASDLHMIYTPSWQSRDGKDGADAEVFFEMPLNAQVFDPLIDNIRAGLAPNRSGVVFVNDLPETAPLHYGPAPDGSHLVWNIDDRDNHTLPIKEVSFWYQKLDPKPPTSDQIEDARRVQDERSNEVYRQMKVAGAVEQIQTDVRLVKLIAIVIGFVVVSWGLIALFN